MNSVTMDYAFDGQSAINLASHNNYDLIILDINLPDLDGFDVCKSLRQQHNRTPIIFLTARDSIEDIEMGFESGAHDYLIKPFQIRELYARAKSLAKRYENQLSTINIGDLSVDFVEETATRKGTPLKLNNHCWKLLSLLAKKHPQIVSKSELEAELWGESPPQTDSLKTTIYQLRKVVDKPFDHPVIKTVPRRGLSIET